MKIPGSRMEFIAYRILYSLYEDNPINANRMLAELTPEMKKDKGVAHALLVRKAFAMRNYGTYFKLYGVAPNMGQYIMEFVFDKLRFEALVKFTKILRPSIDLTFIKRQLAFETDKDCITYLTERGCVFIPATTKPLGKQLDLSLDCKDSFIGLKKWEKECLEKHRISTTDRGV